MSTENQARPGDEQDILKPLDTTRPIIDARAATEKNVRKKPGTGTVEAKDTTRPIIDPNK